MRGERNEDALFVETREDWLEWREIQGWEQRSFTNLISKNSSHKGNSNRLENGVHRIRRSLLKTYE